ncbi:hypothetical protein LSH36_1205g00099 [Paralvinella palmiformis]|uniref:Nucleotide-diphospho-sugar transferase domain-containing protein n=1 Tax=Paralvinella palmiformis TaxID=53620 RepID=A0AAD9ITY7_9ANNE|nr:hypothetical protein LSH36_1205g00099 [Paralvinella palmiformis]
MVILKVIHKTEMALNLYLTSFKKFNIVNHLFVASDNLACAEIEPYGAHCIQYLNMTTAKTLSIFKTVDYNIKSCIKPRIIADFLKSGFDVLLVDLDIVFLKDPLPFFQNCQECDLITQCDSREINSGFFLIRNTSGGIQLFDRIVTMKLRRPSVDQVYVNKAARKLGNKTKIQCLPGDQFQLGNSFFTRGQRLFIGDNPCNQCVIVHNNYIVSLEGKIYRFKEYGLWAVDKHRYYSDKNRMYISYDNPIDLNNKTKYKEFDNKKMDLMSLKAALIIG